MPVVDRKSASILIACLIAFHFTVHSNYFATRLTHHIPHTAAKVDAGPQFRHPHVGPLRQRPFAAAPTAAQALYQPRFVQQDVRSDPPPTAAPTQPAEAQQRAPDPVIKVPERLPERPAAGGAGHPLWGNLLPPAPASIMVTFGSASLSDFMLNWIAHVERIPALRPYVVACMDTELLELLQARNVPAFLAKNAGIVGDKSFLGATGQERQGLGAAAYYRTDGAAFKKMGAVKALVLENLLVAGYDVLISDADTVWFGDPWPVIGRVGQAPAQAANRQLAQADILVSTDCIDYDEDLGPGLVGMEHNTGVLFLRSSNITVKFTQEWQKRALETTDGHDQSEFNRILKGMYKVGQDGKAWKQLSPWPFAPISISRQAGEDIPTDPHEVLEAMDGPRDYKGQLKVREEAMQRVRDTFDHNKAVGRRSVYWMWHGTIRVGILPMAQFMNGHLFFTRQLQTYSGIKPLVVHLTYQFGDTAKYVYGKRQRLREHNLWAPEEDAYFEEGSFLSVTGVEPNYQAIVQPYAQKANFCKETDPVKERCWHPAALVEALDPVQRDPAALTDPAWPHLEVQGWLRGVVRSATLLSKQAGLVMIMPHLQCWCERHWWLLDDCRIPAGAQQMPMPYECPMDHVFELTDWYNNPNMVPFRESQFLQNSRVPSEVHDNKIHLLVDLPAGSEAVIEGNTVRVEWGGTFHAAAAAVAEAKRRLGPGAGRIVQVDARHLRDGFSTCYGSDHNEVWTLNQMFYDTLGGVLIEFCGVEKNPYVYPEIDALMREQGKNIKEGLNCSYPGKEHVVSNPVLWATHITAENRRNWIGDSLKVC